MIKLSVTSKLDGIKSWSLPALSTCPGAHDRDGTMVPVCSGCYARSGRYTFPSVQAVREHNMHDWKRPTWVDAMVHALGSEFYLRWFDSGDIYHPELARRIALIVERTPWCRHWIPTRSHKVPRIRRVLERINALPNACVRYSADELDRHTSGLHGSVVTTEDLPGVTPCRAYERTPALCNGCRACWDKSVAVIGYPAHGALAVKEVTKAA